VNRNVCILNGSQTCEISGFQLQKAINFLKLNGYKIKKGPRGCDTVLVNSCVGVDSKKEDAEEVMDEVLKAGKTRIILFGCLAGIPNKYRDLPEVLHVGPKEIGKLNAYFDCAVPVEAVPAGDLGPEAFTPYQGGLLGSDKYLLISQGCVNSCTFCSIKKAKGALSSRPVGEIVGELKTAAFKGREVTLLSDDCGSYGLDIGTDLAALLEAMAAADPRVRFKISSLYPGALLRLYPRLKPLLAAGRISYLSVPIQSGSPRVLKLMGRRYDIGRVLKTVLEIRKLSASTWIYTHVIINFPTETRADFVRSLRASLCFSERMFINYSDNEGTPASRLRPKVALAEEKERLRLAKALLEKGHPGRLFPYDIDPSKYLFF